MSPTCLRPTIPLPLAVAQDFNQEAKISDQLLAHFTQTWKDRQVYYMARERAKVQRDIMTIIVDSYDHCKMRLPKYPMSRTPKRTIFEATRRNLIELVMCLNLKIPKTSCHICFD